MVIFRGHLDPISRSNKTGGQIKCQKSIKMDSKINQNGRSNKWTLSIGLTLLPTKAKDLKVTIKDSQKLILSGLSKTEQKIGEFGLKSKHEWSKTVQIPSWVDINSIKVNLNEVKEKIVISGLKKNEENDLNVKDVMEVSDE